MEYSDQYILRLLDKFDEHEIGNLETIDSIEEKIRNNEKLTDDDLSYIQKRHEQLITLDETEAKISRGLTRIAKLKDEEIGDPKRLDKMKEKFEKGQFLEKSENDYLQEKLDQLQQVTKYEDDSHEENIPAPPHVHKPSPSGMGPGRKLAIILPILIIIFAAGMFYYSINQIHVDLTEVSFHSIDWIDFSFTTLAKLGLGVLTGNWINDAFDLIEGINLNLTLAIYNNTFFRIYIPEITYEFFIGGVSVGTGNEEFQTSLEPGERKEMKLFQNVKKSRLSPVISSITDSDGVLEIKVSGVAYLQFVGQRIPIPFESTQQISMSDNIREGLGKK